MSLHYTEMKSPVGKLRLVASPVGLRAVLWANEKLDRVSLGERPSRDDDNPILIQTRRQLVEYFAGDRTEFTVPLDPKGTPFQMSVWKVLRSIPFGKTLSYGEQAKRLGDARKARAVGAANGKNPISIIVPCHRVIGKDGSLTGFGGGLDIKRQLLDLEKNPRSRGLGTSESLAPGAS